MFVEKWLDKKPEVNFKIYDVTDWTVNNYDTYTVYTYNPISMK